MDKYVRDNRANQLNPNHSSTGPGRSSGYHGWGTKSDLDNRANQLNPNNWRYQGNRPADSGSSGWCTIL